MKLTFSRDLDTPNLSEIKKLESAYLRHLGLPEPVRRKYPETPPLEGGAIGCATFCFSIIVGGVLWYFIPSFIIGLMVFIGAIIIGSVLMKNVETASGVTARNDAADAAYKEACARVDQEHKQNVQNFYDEHRRIFSEVAKYN